MKYFKFILFLFILNINLSFAQKTNYYTDENILFKKALELFNQKDFSNAYQLFDNYINTNKKEYLLISDANYYKAVCATELQNKDAEFLLKKFLEIYPESNKINDVLFMLGNLYFKNKKYDHALEYYNKTEKELLAKSELSEYYFKTGYAYLEKGNLQKASAAFYEIKDIDNPYFANAAYYYAHIAYQQKKYELALEGFLKLKDNTTFSNIVPYYITHIYFIQNKYQDVINQSEQLIKDSMFYQKLPEINRMVGESYFNLKNYTKASESLEKANQLSSLNNSGNFMLGYSYYQLKKYSDAIKYLEKAVGKEDSIAQNAWYHLADCYLNTGDKSKAKNAFYGASTMNSIPRITEDALFNYAKLCYELEYDPFNETINAFNLYIKNYPNSPRKDDAINYLINAYASTKNYEKAIESIEKLSVRTPQIEQTYQRLLYNIAIKYFNDKNLSTAQIYFNRALKLAGHPHISALCQYWLAEIAYQNKDYSKAIEDWKNFQVMPLAASMKEYELTNYNLGYAYLKKQTKEDIQNATLSFAKYANSTADDIAKKSDASTRAGDGFFIQQNFAMAIDYYNKVIQLSKGDVEYAMYQKSLCLGLLKKYDEKINTLKTLIEKFSKSEYTPKAILEIADTYNNDMKNPNASITYYKKFIDEYPNAPQINKAMSSLGLTYYAQKDDNNAFLYLDKVVKNNPKGEDAQELLPIIKKIFEAKGQIGEMEKYFESIGNPLSVSQVESSLYESAKDYYYNQKSCEKSMPLFEEYIKKFSMGRYIAEIHYCLAECLYNSNDTLKIISAMSHYEYVINQPSRYLFTESALSKLSFYLYKQKNYQSAYPLFVKLSEISEEPNNIFQAKWYALKSAFSINNFEKVPELSNYIIASDKANTNQIKEAKYIRAVGMFEQQQYNDAEKEFQILAKSLKSSNGARCYIYSAKIELSQNKYKEVEKTINELLSYQYATDDIKAEGMLILSDCYMQQNDYVNAKVILETLINSQPKQNILLQAQQKLQEVNNKLNQNDNKKETQDTFDKMLEEYQNNQKTN